MAQHIVSYAGIRLPFPQVQMKVELTSMIQSIIKRDGRVVLYDQNKIASAILRALEASHEGDAADAARIANDVQRELENRFSSQSPNIEAIQDAVERQLMNHGFSAAAKAYILYRANRTRAREANTSLMKTIDEITNIDARISDMKRDNANIDGNTAMGSMLQIGSAGAKAYNEIYLLRPEHAKAYRDGDIHIHDFDFYSLTTTCCQIDILKLFHGGFSTGHGYLREPNSIASYAALAAIAIQSNQNDQHGGQSIPNFDYGMAEGVAKTYRKAFTRRLKDAVEDYLDLGDEAAAIDAIVAAAENATGEVAKLESSDAFLGAIVKGLREQYGIDCEKANKLVTRASIRAYKKTDRDTQQAMEGFVHNLNTMHSRAGAQTPFSSINYGTDTSPEGRMVIRNILLALEAGLGHGETCIFPIHIFKVKEGVNYNETDPNYDLFRLSCKVSAKRLFPNYTFLDSPFNLQYYVPGRPETEVATMGCRTRVMGNVYDPSREISYSRGNLSFTSINLPRLAIEADHDEELFYEKLHGMMELVAQQLLDRFEIQASKHIYNYPFLMGQGIWLDSDKLTLQDDLREVLKHGTLSIGFIGLAETLTALYGQHHGQDEELLENPGLHRTLLGDGVGSMAGAIFGGCPNTTYGESVGCVAITRNASVVTITATAILAVLVSFISPFVAFLDSIPGCVMGGVCITLYGFIAVSGLKMIQKVDLEDNANLFTTSVILITGIGGMAMLIGKVTLTAIACALILGILTNIMVNKGRKKNDEE